MRFVFSDIKARAERLREAFAGRFALMDCDFGRLAELDLGVFHGALFDLGVSSFQLDDAARGFSFRQDAPADMRMDPRHGVPAGVWLGGDRQRPGRHHHQPTDWECPMPLTFVPVHRWGA